MLLFDYVSQFQTNEYHNEICDYYGISKEMKSNKYNKEEIINVLVQFENNPINNDIFLRRQKMWYFIDKLKNDKFMKKYVLWN